MFREAAKFSNIQSLEQQKQRGTSGGGGGGGGGVGSVFGTSTPSGTGWTPHGCTGNENPKARCCVSGVNFSGGWTAGCRSLLLTRPPQPPQITANKLHLSAPDGIQVDDDDDEELRKWISAFSPSWKLKNQQLLMNSFVPPPLVSPEAPRGTFTDVNSTVRCSLDGSGSKPAFLNLSQT